MGPNFRVHDEPKSGKQREGSKNQLSLLRGPRALRVQLALRREV